MPGRLTGGRLFHLLLAAIILITTAGVLHSAASAAQRFALVIGVSEYGPRNSLRNPVNDAKLIADSLRSIGFEDESVKSLPNPTKGQMRDALNELYNKVQSQPDAFVMIYFAGHAAQMEGVNYLLPKGTDLLGGNVTPGDYEDQGFNAQLLLSKFGRSRANDLLVIIDACRDNPFGGASGLAELSGVESGPNWMIAFAAMAGQTAADGRGANSPYALALSEELKTPDRTVTQVFEGVKDRFAANPDLARQRPYSKGAISLRLFQTPVSQTQLASIAKGIAEPGAARSSGQRGAPGRVDMAEIVGVDRVAGGEDGMVLLKDALARRSLAEIRDAAESGDAFSLYLLGLATWEGRGGAVKDLEKAVWYLRLAVSRGSGRAASSLGVYLCCTDGGPKNDKEAVEWFRVGDALNAPNATRNLAVSYRDGTGVEKNLPEAIKLFTKAGENGSALAWSNLGWMYENDDFALRDREKARSYFRKAVEMGDQSSIERYADGYRFGLLPDGSDKAPDRALSIYVKAGMAGCGLCWRHVGELYREPVSGEPDPAAALAAFSKGADAGDATSMIEAARILKAGDGDGIAKSPTAAFAMYERARAVGSQEGKGSVGLALARGEGVERNPARAAVLLREVLALDRSSDPEQRHSVYAPNYWGYAYDLAKLIAQGLVQPANPSELADLRARYGSEAESNMKRFTVPIDCGDQRVPFYVYVVNWSRPNDETPVDDQAAWLKSQRGCTVPSDVLTSFTKLKRIATEKNVSFVDLCVYALGAAQKEKEKEDKAEEASEKPKGVVADLGRGINARIFAAPG